MKAKTSGILGKWEDELDELDEAINKLKSLPNLFDEDDCRNMQEKMNLWLQSMISELIHSGKILLDT